MQTINHLIERSWIPSRVPSWIPSVYSNPMAYRPGLPNVSYPIDGYGSRQCSKYFSGNLSSRITQHLLSRSPHHPVAKHENTINTSPIHPKTDEPSACDASMLHVSTVYGDLPVFSIAFGRVRIPVPAVSPTMNTVAVRTPSFF